MQSTNEKEKATILGIIPRYAALPLLIVVAWNMCVYFGNRIFFIFPFGFHFVELVTHLGQFLLYIFQMRLGEFIILFL